MRTGGVERAGDPPAARRAAMAAGRRPARGAGLVNLAAMPSGSRTPLPLPATTRQNRETAAVVLVGCWPWNRGSPARTVPAPLVPPFGLDLEVSPPARSSRPHRRVA